MDRRVRAGLGLALASMAITSACAAGTIGTVGQSGGADPVDVDPAPLGQPNVLVLTADDATVADLRSMPHTRRLLGEAGTTLTDMVAPTPLCVPARASLLTGQYAHNHGARGVGADSGFGAFVPDDTLPVWLRDAGYSTGFVGKYLNGYEDVGFASVPPGWDRWRGFSKGTYNYRAPTVSVDGLPRQIRQYSTDVVSDLTVDLLRSQMTEGVPWFTWVNYVAPHHGQPVPRSYRARARSGASRVSVVPPAPRHRGLFDGRAQPRTPDLFRSAAPRPWFAGPRWDRRERADALRGWRLRQESLQAVDEAVRRAVTTVREGGQLRDTVIVFLSDNGFLTGRQRHYGKVLPYNDVLRVPALVRGPGFEPGTTSAAPVVLPDLTATIVSMAGAVPGRLLDGVDLRDSLAAPDRERAVPISAWRPRTGGRQLYYGVRVGDLTYARQGAREVLFDRSTDPYELTDRRRDSRYAATLARVRRLADEMKQCIGETCRRFGGVR